MDEENILMTSESKNALGRYPCLREIIESSSDSEEEYQIMNANISLEEDELKVTSSNEGKEIIINSSSTEWMANSRSHKGMISIARLLPSTSTPINIDDAYCEELKSSDIDDFDDKSDRKNTTVLLHNETNIATPEYQLTPNKDPLLPAHWPPVTVFLAPDTFENQTLTPSIHSEYIEGTLISSQDEEDVIVREEVRTMVHRGPRYDGYGYGDRTINSNCDKALVLSPASTHHSIEVCLTPNNYSNQVTRIPPECQRTSDEPLIAEKERHPRASKVGTSMDVIDSSEDSFCGLFKEKDVKGLRTKREVISIVNVENNNNDKHLHHNNQVPSCHDVVTDVQQRISSSLSQNGFGAAFNVKACLPTLIPYAESIMDPRMHSSVGSCAESTVDPRIDNSVGPCADSTMDPRIDNSVGPCADSTMDPRVGRTFLASEVINEATRAKFNQQSLPQYNLENSYPGDRRLFSSIELTENSAFCYDAGFVEESVNPECDTMASWGRPVKLSRHDIR